MSNYPPRILSAIADGRLYKLATPWKCPVVPWLVSWRVGRRDSILPLSSTRWCKAGLAFFHTSSPLRRAPSKKYPPLTHLEIEQMKVLLLKGFQVWEIALSIGRSELDVRRSLRNNDGLASLLRKVKTGRWSSAEEHVLLEHLKERSVPNKKMIARRIGRKVDSVVRQIKKLANERDAPMPLLSADIPLDNELSTSERETLEVRLDRILVGLTKADKTDKWRRVLMGTPRAEWVERILALIPTPVGHILAASSPPTISRLRSLEWEDTNKMGVYTWILTHKLYNPFYPEHYVYVGSATKYGEGLSRRKFQHQYQQGGKHSSPYLKSRIRKQGLDRKGPFITLLSMDVTSSEPNEVVKARQFIVLAEAIFTIWLGALTEGREGTKEEHILLRSLCPWSPEQISYGGMCSHNPLSFDISYPSGYAQPEDGLCDAVSSRGL
ncbi:hypothetical protein F4813DRAFT_313106 [Daldinia decipiens]|uniref:uncharacterized protein n=1 Tax=Daldinia decipiens TaxID=326647 RepID=UPI0020C26BE9|nr:uncharacterized protein F4813DRAFT_313106 [Daldinia decipiens]KAI1660095.1 hypothetical protein F4813DRAFT_313106 [Daldinia decipiens]